MTKKLFWEDPYATECTATVTSIEGNNIKLDQTIFFAFSGGQSSDEGTMGGINVTEATKEGDKENIIDIAYQLEREPDFKVGDEVIVKINKERREKLMKLHSAVHIVYYLLEEMIGEFACVGSNIHQEKGRIDVNIERNLNELLPELEEKTNSFLAEGHEIIRKADEEQPELQWWMCEEWKMACGGTHVRNTNEIGAITLKRKSKGAGKERIEVVLKE